MTNAGEYPITIVRGTDFAEGLRIRQNCEVQLVADWGLSAVLVNAAGATVSEFTVTEVDPTAVCVALAHADTAALTKGSYQWQIWSTRASDGFVSQLLTGRAVVI
jgi:hypothetical protein